MCCICVSFDYGALNSNVGVMLTLIKMVKVIVLVIKPRYSDRRGVLTESRGAVVLLLTNAL